MSHLKTIYQKIPWQKKTSIGLDIQESYIAMMELKFTKNKPQLISHTLITLDAKNNKEQIRYQAIKKLLTQITTNYKNIIIAMPFAYTKKKIITIPSNILKTTTIKNLLYLNSEQLLGIDDINDYYFDYYLNYPQPQNTEDIYVTVITAEKNIARQNLNLSTFSNHDLITIDVDIYALLRASLQLYPTFHNRPYFIVNLGQEKLLFIYIKNNTPEYVQETIFSKSHIETESIVTQLSKLMGEESISEALPIIICGYHATAGLIDNLKTKITNKIHLANPWQINKPALILAYGLALHGTNHYHNVCY